MKTANKEITSLRSQLREALDKQGESETVFKQRISELEARANEMISLSDTLKQEKQDANERISELKSQCEQFEAALLTQDMKLSEDEEEIEVPPIDSVLGLTTMLEEKETLVQQLTGQLEENRKLLETTQQSTESSLKELMAVKEELQSTTDSLKEELQTEMEANKRLQHEK